jgi:hypothetical protein
MIPIFWGGGASGRLGVGGKLGGGDRGVGNKREEEGWSLSLEFKLC